MGEFETTAAAPFRHSHQTTLARANLLYYFTLEKRWMSSDDAKKLISLAAARGCYIEEKEGEYTLAEALQDEKIPLGFRPTDAVFAVPENEDPVEQVLKILSEKTGKELKELAGELQTIQKHFDDLIGAGTAAVILSRRYGHEIPARQAASLAKADEA